MPPAASAIDSLFFETRRVGEASCTVVSEGALLWPPRFSVPEAAWREALPEADARGRVWLGLNTVIVRLGDAVIIIDPGLDDPDSAWQRARPRVWPDWPVTRSPGLAVAMEQLAISADDVTHVLITHPHGDHYAGVAVEGEGALVARFPGALHLMGRADWEGNPGREFPGSDLARLEMIDRLGRLELVDASRDIVPGVTMLAAPGESPGHCIVLVESAGERLYILGDLVHHAAEVEHPAWGPPHADMEAIGASRREWFARIAAERALAVTAHEPFPPWGRIVPSGDGYRWERA